MDNNKTHMNFSDVTGNEVHFECIKSFKGEITLPASKRMRLFFIMKGTCFFSYEHHLNMKLYENYVVMVPPKSKCVLWATDDVKMVIVNLTVTLNFCEDFPIESLIAGKAEEMQTLAKDRVSILKTDNIINNFLVFLTDCMQSGISNDEFLQMKQKELLYYFGLLYTREELYYFFSPILNRDIAFSRLIYKHFDQVHKLEDFAKIMNYSISGFKKRFMRVFGIPAYQWLCNEKAKRIYHAITCSRETFTQLAFEFGFSSPAHFNNFCKKKFNATPGEIREQNLLRKSI